MIGLPDGWVGEGGAENSRKYGLPRNADGILNDHMFPSNPGQALDIFKLFVFLDSIFSTEKINIISL